MIKRTTLKEQVYKHLREVIIRGELEPDKIYSEQSFAELLNVSRTPVREAILQLKNEDFLEIHPNKGFSVKKVTISDVRKILHLRIAIEGYCCMYLAEHAASPKAKPVIEELEGLLENLETIEREHLTTMDFMECDLRFHTAIVKFCGNPQMVSIMQSLRSRVDRIGTFSLGWGNRMDLAIHEHRNLLNCIEAGDGIGSYTALREHVMEMVKLIELNCGRCIE